MDDFEKVEQTIIISVCHNLCCVLHWSVLLFLETRLMERTQKDSGFSLFEVLCLWSRGSSSDDAEEDDRTNRL